MTSYPRDRLRAQLVAIERDLDAALAGCEAASMRAEAAAEARIDLAPHLEAIAESIATIREVARRGLATLELVVASVPAGSSLTPSASAWIDRRRREFRSCIAMADRDRPMISRPTR
ncbi:hypothetical protein ACQEVB_11715 [Pseudonocardia sp. CA-107938]|uniref:hypothetical protein n=1 Tax=Pseudonocardia sp. CA-107938 TaxID=3240021 RepID=UPI003D8ACA12